MRTAPIRPGESAFRARVIRTYPDPGTEKRWRTFLRRARWASHFVSPEYFLDPKVRGKKPFAVLVEHGGEVVACLTGWHAGSPVVSGMQTHPELVILDTPYRYPVEKALAGALLQEAQGSSFVVVHSWGQLGAFRDSGFWSQQCTSTYVVDLSLDEDTLFQDLDSKKRNGIRNAIKRGLEVREANSRDLPKFHEVLTATHKRLGIGPPLLPGDLLTPETNRKLFVAYHRGRCVAGTIVRYQRGGLAEYSENASLPEFWRFRPNDLLLWESIKWAKSIGCKAFNFGGQDSFKKEFGGTLYPIFRTSLDQSLFRWRHGRERLEMLARQLYRAAKKRVFQPIRPS